MEKYRAPALGKGLEILDYLYEKGGMSFNDLLSLLDTNPGSLSRYLNTLIQLQYIYKDKNQKYQLGLKFSRMGQEPTRWKQIKDVFAPALKDISKKYAMTVLLLGYMKGQVVAIHKVQSQDNLGMMPIGSVFKDELDTLWSSKFYQKHVERTLKNSEKSSLTKDEISEISSFVSRYGYVRYAKDSKKILRFGFPIYIDGEVVATIGIGTFYGLVTEETLIEIVKDIQITIRKLLFENKID